ncbi:MAG: WxPxxD family membrane protein [Oliverpabstia sp.]|nr:WxPxxD family membrane protein [Eubacterium sp.]MDY2594210.1 WxPxxD family membrane protein [Oliverpabstia sp.]
MKFRYMVLIIVYGMLFAVDCHFSNYPILNMIHTEYLSETDVLMSLHDSVNGYNGLLEMLFVYTLPFLLGSYYISDKQVFFRVVRYGTRRKYKQAETKKMILAATIFTIIHQVIDFLYTTANFKWPLLMEYSFGLYTIVAGVIAVLFYIQTGLIYQIIRDWIKKDLAALLITLGLNFVQYVLIKYSIVKCWIMGKDLFVAFDFFSGNCDLYVILFTIIRSLLFSICLYLINQVLFEKKDIIRYEK